MTVLPAVTLAVMLVMTLVVTGGGAILHAGEPLQVAALNPELYQPAGTPWPILDLATSALLPGYAFAQVQGSAPPTFDSSELYSDTGVLTIIFSETIDVTPTTNVVPTKIHIRESGSYTGGITLSAGELGTTAADGTAISFTLTASHRATVVGLATPKLTIEPGAVRDTSGNTIEGTFDISTAVFVDYTLIRSWESLPSGMAFSNDGTKMFVVGTSGDDIDEYTLSAAFDASTLSFVNSTSILNQTSSPSGMAFSNDGLKMFVTGFNNKNINEYALSTAFDASTREFVRAKLVQVQEKNPSGMAFSSDGLKMFVVGTRSDAIHEYTMPTPFDIYRRDFVHTISVATWEGSPQDVAFSNDGLKMFVIGNSKGAMINEYALSTAFDVSTAAHAGSLSVSSEETSPQGMAFSNDGAKMFVVGTSGDDINEYTLNSVYPITVTTTSATTPTLASIQRYNPATQNTNSQTLVYKVTFSENVTGVDVSDFALSSDSTGGTGGSTGISGSGDVYYVTVSVTQDGTYNLDLVSSGHGITDAAANPLTNTTPTTGIDQTYTVRIIPPDNTVPTLVSIQRSSPAVENTGSQTLVYEVTFSEDVTGVDASDFALSPGSIGGVGSTNTGSSSGQFMQTRSPALAIPDTDTVSDTITVSNSGTATSVYVAVDITHAHIGDLKIDLIAPDGTTRTLHNYEGGHAKAIDQTYTLSFADVSIAGTWTLRIHDGFNVYHGVLNSWTLTVNYGDAATIPVTGISGSGDVYYVTVSALQDGIYNLDLVSSGHGIADTASNPLTDTDPTGADETYIVSITVIDTIYPRLESIERYNPASQNTTSQTLIYMATFSENVTGVDASDFILSPDSAGGTGGGSSPVTDVSGSDDVYSVTVSALQDGIYNLDLVSSGHGIADTASNPLTDTDPTGADETYIVSITVIDTIYPRLESIERYNPASQNTTSQTLIYMATFSENVTGVDASDFILSPDSAGGTGGGSSPVTDVSGSDDVYSVTVSALQDGIYNLDLVSSGHGIADTASNPLTDTDPTGADETYIVSITVIDTIYPRLESIERYNPASQNTTSQTLIYMATFSENVTGVDASDFILSPDSAGGTGGGSSPVTDVSGSDDVYSVTVSALQDGIYNLDLVSSGHGIADTASNPLTDTDPTGADETYIVSITVIDTIYPRLESIERYNPASQNTTSQTLIYMATFSENVTGVDASDFILSPDSAGGTGGGSSPVTDVSGSDDVYSVTVSALQDGIYNLDLISSGHGIADTASNPLTDTDPTGADQTYIVSITVIDTIYPRLESIERYNPASQNTTSQTLIYMATFSENVTGVDASDFILSPDSAGGTGGGSSPVTDVSGSDDVYSVTVSALQDGIYNLDLISSGHGIADTASNPLTDTDPTGADQTYIVSITVIDTIYPRLESIERYNPASQNTTSQTLIYMATFSENVTGVDASDFILSPDSAGGTGGGSSPVTDVSGSDDVYSVTVSALQDGIYNLDLISSGHGIADTASNPLTDTDPTGADQTYIVSITVIDTIYPRLESIERYNPASQNTTSQTLIYMATFSENVTGVDASDFILSPDSAGGTGGGSSPVTDVSGSDDVYSVTVSALQDGIYNLDLVSSGHGIADTASNPLTDTDPTGADQTYIVSITVIDTIYPRLESIERYNPASQNTTSQTLIYMATFSENVTGVDASDFILSPDSAGGTGGGSSPVTDVSGSDDVYSVTVSALQDGIYNLDLISSGHGIADTASNPLTDTDPTGADQTYIVSITVIDTIYPRLESIERYNPASQNTTSQTLIYMATFSENVTGVDASDFILSPDSAGGTGGGSSPVTDVSGSDDVYSVTVSASTNGIYNLDLISSGHGIADTASNPLTDTDPTGADQTYIVSITVIDTIYPRLESIERYNPASQNTTSQTLIYMATFSENVTGVDASDFILSPDSAGGTGGGSSPVTDVSGSDDVYSVTVFASTNGTYNLDLISSGHGIADTASNPLTDTDPTGADQTYIVSITVIDTIYPRLESIERYNPASQNTTSQTLIYMATFSENVTGVDASDFILSPDSAGGGNTSASTGQFTHTRSPNLAIPYDVTVSDTITVSSSGTVASVSVTVDITHTYIGDLKIDLIAPDGTTRTLHDREGGTANNIYKTYTLPFGSVPISGVWTLQINDNYDADSGVLNSWTLTVNYADAATIPVTGISGSGDVYSVTVSALQDGIYNLDLISSGHGIADTASNPLTDTDPTGADQTYIVSITVIDTIYPRLESIERYNPASQNTTSQTLIYMATFSENVTGVDASDFILSPDSAGGGNTSASTGQFTHTRSPNLAIPYDVTVSDTITVSSSGTVASVSVTVDITHTYIGDLKIDLIAPDGTTRTLHDRKGGTANNIYKTYTMPFGSVPISGVWTLQINDNYDADSGVLNSWTLTVNYADAATIPVTGISGSGDVYYVTVSALQDGIYNLDLVSSGHGIADTASNPLTDTDPTGADQTYIVSITVIDTIYPRLESIERYNPASQNTTSQTLIYMATFSENVTGVDASDFILSPDSAGGTGGGSSPVTDVSGSDDVYSVTVFASTNGTYNLDLISSGHGIADTASNPLTDTDPTGADQTYIVSITVIDTIYPRLESIERYNPASQNTTSQTLIYMATFSENVTGVDASDFILSPDSAGGTGGGSSPVTDVSGSDDVYSVTVFASTNGTYNLDLISSGHGIADTASNPLTDTDPTGADQTYIVSITVIDTIYPRLESIERYNPASQNTTSQTLIYMATFSENVTGVDASDFILSPDSAGGTGGGSSPVTDVSGSDDVYSVTVFASTNGTYNLDLISSGHGIADTASNPLTDTDPTGADQTYIVSITVIDTIYPRLESIERYNPASQNTTSQTLIYMATFSENVTGVDASDFILSPDSAGGTGGGSSPVTDVSGSDDVYSVTVFASTNGTYNLDLISSGHGIADTASNPLTDTDPTGADQTYIVSITVIDTIYPRLESIERYNPASQNTTSQTLIYMATFSENVTGVDASDFILSPDSAGGGNTSASTGQFTHTRSPNLAIPYDVTVSDTITVSSSGTVASVSVTVDITHTYIGDLKIDLIAPDGTTRTLHDREGGTANNIYKTYTLPFGSVPISGVWTLQINDNYDADSGVLNSWTLTVNYADAATIPVTGISGSGDVYYVTVSALQDGIYNLDLISSGHGIADTASNPLTDTDPTGADQTYIVSITVIDTIYPRLESIERYNPASQNTTSQTLIYMATFSENVTGVDASDFILSPDSAGGGNTSASTGQFTHTRSPNLAIPYDVTVSDTITVSSSGTVASVSVTVDITHTYIGDLKIDLIAPDGTTRTLHDREGGTANNIYKTYTLPFGSVPISGVWTLQINDNYDADSGVLNSWTLTVNYADAATIPVTGISGSGDVYYVTVSALQDGIYNLDLISSGHGIADTASNPLTDTDPTGADQTYIVSITVIDTIYPRLESIERYNPASQNTTSQTLIYMATFSENVTGVDASDFILSPDSAGGTGGGSSPVTDVSGSDDVYSVTVFASTNGTYNLDLISSGHGIADTVSNPLTDTDPTGADQTYIVSITVIDTIYPRLESIERYNPASQNTTSQTLIYMATFSENVTGVDASDFILSPDSTWGGNTSASTGQFTHTRSPNLAIPDTDTVSDTITVSSSGTVASVSVTVDITHTYIGDLKIDLIAPDGTTRTLHDREGGTANNIYKTYILPFGSVPISGVWTLQINDNYDADSGVLNSWTLTVNYADAATIPVTGISGSGDVYYVTVSALQDGIYNLDLVSSGHGIADTASNPLTDTDPTGADQTYIVSITVIDTIYPRLESIERYNPASQNTTSQTLIYMATFSENVTGVDASDFILSPDSAGGTGGGSSPVTDVSGSDDVYSVTVFASTNGTYNLDLISSGHGIADTASNPLTDTDPTGADETYIVSITVIDTIYPRLESIERYNPASQNTTSQTLIYMATFSENVTGVDASDFILSPDSAGGTGGGSSPVTDVSGSDDVYSVTVFASTNGTYNLDLISSGHGIADTASNPLTDTDPTGADQTYIVSITVIDTIYPRLESIERYNPASQNTTSQTLIYMATFSENVTGVDASDFILSPDSTWGGNTSASTGQFTHTRSPNLAIPYDVTVSDTITVSSSGTVASVSVTVDITHTYIGDLKIDLIAPDGTTRTLHDREGGTANNIYKTYTLPFGSVPISGVWTLQINDNYDVDSGVLNSWTLTVNYADAATIPVTGISGSGDVYYVTVSALQDGIYNLDLISSGHGIADTASNPLTDTDPTGADQTYIVSITVIDTIYPRLESIERYNPASQNTTSQTLIYMATFSENVTGVDASDFILSPDSTWGGNTSASTGQFTHTRSPNLAILYDVTVSDTITVSSSGTVASVSVTVDITHTYIGDLKIDLIAPDGTTRTLHDRKGGTANNIYKTYTMPFGSVPISGVWTLQINDNYDADSGVLNSWTLTVNYADAATIPVTGISGSGDVYYVTVSALQDGIYNLDLISSGHGIADTASNPLTDTDPTGADQTYTVS